MPPANAAAISQVLADIANIYPPLLTRPEQQTYLKKLTSNHKFTYYSATYGHTTHDAASLRKVLANTMRHHPNPEYGTAGGNAAVDMLFEHGCEMLEPAYVKEVRLAAVDESVERRGESDDETSEDEEMGMLLQDVVVGESSEHDEDFIPPRKRPRRRGGWRDSAKPEKLKRKHRGKVIEAATSPPLGENTRDTKKMKAWRRSHVGEWNRITCSQQREQESGRDGPEVEVDRLQGCRRVSALAVQSWQPRQPAPLRFEGGEESQDSGGRSDNVRLREAVEKLNRRVHTAIVQLWDEVGGIA